MSALLGQVVHGSAKAPIPLALILDSALRVSENFPGATEDLSGWRTPAQLGWWLGRLSPGALGPGGGFLDQACSGAGLGPQDTEAEAGAHPRPALPPGEGHCPGC